MIIVFANRALFNQLVIDQRFTLDGVDLPQGGAYQPAVGADGRCLMDFPISPEALANLKERWAEHLSEVQFLDAIPVDWQYPQEGT